MQALFYQHLHAALCLGGYMGILAKGCKRAVSTTNRNFIGRMGDVDSEIYLSNLLVAAASAVTGDT